MEPISSAVGIGFSIAGAGLAFDQADQQRSETAERVRRYMLYADRTQSRATALGNASGIEGDSASLTSYLNDMQSEFRKNANWMTQATERVANSEDSATNLKLASSIFGMGSSSANWFHSPSVG